MEKAIKQIMISSHETPRFNRVLGNWVGLSKQLKLYDEDDVLKLLKLELTGRKRLDIIQRLYGRYTILRKKREKKVMVKIYTDGKTEMCHKSCKEEK